MKKILIPIFLLISSCSTTGVQAEDVQYQISESQESVESSQINNSEEYAQDLFYIRYEYYKQTNLTYYLNNILTTEILNEYLNIYYIDNQYIEETPNEWVSIVQNIEPNWSLYTSELIFHKIKNLNYQIDSGEIIVNIKYTVAKLIYM